MLDPKRFSPVGTVTLHTEREALESTKKTFEHMIEEIDNQIKQQLVDLAEGISSHYHPASFRSIYNSGEYITELFEINSWFVTNHVIPTVLPDNHKAVIEMETRYKEKERLRKELEKVEQALRDYDMAPNDEEKRNVVNNYYSDSHTYTNIGKRIENSNEHRPLNIRGTGANHQIKKMKKNDAVMDRYLAIKAADPNNKLLNTALDANLHFRANYQAVLRGRKIRSESEQKVILLSHALKIQKYQKKAAKLEAKRDAAAAMGNAAKANAYQVKADKVQEKINKPISAWNANLIKIKESAKDLFRIHRGFQDYRPWEVRRAEALEAKIDKKL